MSMLWMGAGAMAIFGASVAGAVWFLGRHDVPDTKENRWDAGHSGGGASDFRCGGGGCGGGG